MLTCREGREEGWVGFGRLFRPLLVRVAGRFEKIYRQKPIEEVSLRYRMLRLQNQKADFLLGGSIYGNGIGADMGDMSAEGQEEVSELQSECTYHCSPSCQLKASPTSLIFVWR